MRDHARPVRFETGLWFLLLSACAPSSFVSGLDGEGGQDAALPLDAASHALALFSESGEARVLDPVTGDVQLRATLASALTPLDASPAMAANGAPDGLFVFGADEEEGENVLEALALSGAVPPRELGYFGGSVRVLGVAQGALVTQEDLGERWKLLPHSGAFQSSKACGRPQSIRVAWSTPEQTRIEALSAWPDGLLSSLDVLVEPGGVRRCVARPLEVDRALSEDARLVELGGPTSRALVDLHFGELSVGPLDGLSVTSWASIPVDSSALEHAIVVDLEGERRALVALASGPPRLVAAEIATAPDMTVKLGIPVDVDLPFEPSRARRVVSRDLVAIDGSIFVATSGGVFVYSLEADAGLAFEQRSLPGFGEGELRGPLVSFPVISLP